MSDADPLYARDLLRLAARATGAGHLAQPDRTGSAHNPACGDHVTIEISVGSHGEIRKISHHTKACVLAQASASILGAHLGGASEAAVRSLRARVAEMLANGPAPEPPFADYAALKGAAAFPGRHTCVLLPIDAVLDALKA